MHPETCFEKYPRARVQGSILGIYRYMKMYKCFFIRQPSSSDLIEHLAHPWMTLTTAEHVNVREINVPAGRAGRGEGGCKWMRGRACKWSRECCCPYDSMFSRDFRRWTRTMGKNAFYPDLKKEMKINRNRIMRTPPPYGVYTASARSVVYIICSFLRFFTLGKCLKCLRILTFSNFFSIIDAMYTPTSIVMCRVICSLAENRR